MNPLKQTGLKAILTDTIVWTLAIMFFVLIRYYGLDYNTVLHRSTQHKKHR